MEKFRISLIRGKGGTWYIRKLRDRVKVCDYPIIVLFFKVKNFTMAGRVRGIRKRVRSDADKVTPKLVLAHKIYRDQRGWILGN